MDPGRTVVEDGAVAIDGDTIRAVGPVDELAAAHDADRVVDARGHVVLPGFINAHVHVADILSRGFGKRRRLYDWLFNAKRPFVAAMDADDHAVAAALYCAESLAGGITTFVENAGGTGAGYDDDVIARKLAVYEAAGVRNVYAHGFLDEAADDALDAYVRTQLRKEPDVVHPESEPVDTDEAIDRTESLIERYHGTRDGRQSVWPAPYLAWGVSAEGLERAYDLAERHDVMTTTHAAETPEQERHLASSIEHLDAAGYLGERTLLGHCVQVSERDIGLLARSDTSVSHNIATNLALGSGVAPVPSLLSAGVAVGLGTDNSCQNDTTSVIADMRLAALSHQGKTGDPAAVTAERVLEMATIRGARAIGRGDDLGSLEPGKHADVVCLDASFAHLRAEPNPAACVVYQALGHEVDTVVCDGRVVYEDGRAPGVVDRYPELAAEADRRAAAIADRAGLDALGDAEWSPSRSPTDSS